MRHRFLVSLLLLGAVLPGHHAAPARAAAPTAPVSAPTRAVTPPPRVQSDLDCTNSPFGRVLTLGAEREPLLSFRGGGSENGLLRFDRLDATGPSTLARLGTAPSGTPAAAYQNIGLSSSTAADLNADGKLELVQVFNDASGQVRTASHFADGSVTLRQFPFVNHQQLVAGTIARGPDFLDRVVIASRSAVGSLQLVEVDPIGETVNRLWRTDQNNRANVQLLSMAVGDLDGDGDHDDIVLAFKQQDGAAQIVVLTTANVPTTGSGSNIITNIREIGTKQLNIGTAQNLRVATADIDGDNKDEIIYVQEQFQQDTPGVSSGLAIRTFDVAYTADRTSGQINESASLNIGGATSDLALAAGDTDRDGLAEFVVGTRDYGSSAGLRLRLFKLSSALVGGQPGFTIGQRAIFADSGNQRTVADGLTLALGDMDKNGLEDVLAAFRDAGGALQTLRLTDQRGPSGALTLLSSLRDTAGGRSGATQIGLSVADWDNDSLKAHLAPTLNGNLTCKTVVEPNVTSAVFAPPFWTNIQQDQERYASIGESRSREFTTERGITTSRSHSVSAYFGFEVDAEVAEFEARVTAGYEYAASKTVSGGTTTGETRTEGWTNPGGSFVVVENATYNCYNYETRVNNGPVDGNVRFCEYVSFSELGPAINTWDVQYGPQNNGQATQWAPIARDWSNLALFRGAAAVQSDGGPSAAKATDGNTDGAFANGSVSITPQQTAPWWQIDLGAVQPVNTVRVWNRTDRDCGGGALCPERLSNFHVFVSDVDPRTISDDPAVLQADARVKHFFNAGVGGPVTSFLTHSADNQAISGRFVRVQLAGSGVLSLAEVQVFGGNQVEPDRYPVSISDPDGKTVNGKYVPGTDGWFLAKVFNPATRTYQDVRTRGNLLWDGSLVGVLQNKTVGPGGGQPTWSLEQERTNFQTEAESVSNSVRVGVEFDVAVGVVSKVKAGGGYEFSSGVERAESRSTALGTGFEIGGGVQGFPEQVNGKPYVWPSQCNYGFQPYYYELTERSNSGYEHRMLVVDYIVPQRSLDRDKNMVACHEGPPAPNQGNVDSNFDVGAPGSVFVLNAQGFAPNTFASISLREPGASGFRPLTRVKTDGDGKITFVFATRTGDPLGTYTVRFAPDVLTAAVAGFGTAAANYQELNITLSAAATQRTEQPAGAPVAATSARRLIFLPKAYR